MKTLDFRIDFEFKASQSEVTPNSWIFQLLGGFLCLHTVESSN